MSKNYIVCNTKGGPGKSIVSTMALPVLLYDDVQDKKITIYHLDDNNDYCIETKKINIRQLKVKDAGTVIDEVEFAGILQKDEINIIDAGGSSDTISLLMVIKKTKIDNLCFVIPVLDDIEQVSNLNKTISMILDASPNAKIHVVLNRVFDPIETSVKEQFIGIFGSEKYGVKSYLDTPDDIKITYSLLRDSVLFSLLKSVYGITLLDAYCNAQKLLLNLPQKKKEWVALGLVEYKKHNQQVRLAHDVTSLVMEIRELMVNLLPQNGGRK